VVLPRAQQPQVVRAQRVVSEMVETDGDIAVVISPALDFTVCRLSPETLYVSNSRTLYSDCVLFPRSRNDSS